MISNKHFSCPSSSKSKQIKLIKLNSLRIIRSLLMEELDTKENLKIVEFMVMQFTRGTTSEKY